MLIGERFKFRDNPLELPEREMRRLIYLYQHEYEPPKLHSPPFLCIVILVYGRGEHAG